MKVQADAYGDVTLLSIVGELVADSIGRFNEAVQRHNQGPVRDFVIDLEGITSIDSAGLEALARFQQSCEEQLGMVQFCNADQTVRKILEMTRLDKRFQLHPNIEEAIASFAPAT